MRLISTIVLTLCCLLCATLMLTFTHTVAEPMAPVMVQPIVFAPPTVRVTPPDASRGMRRPPILEPSASPMAGRTVPAAGTPTPLRPASTSTPDDVWDRIAACESGGRWATDTGNGYFGGLQEDLSFWRSYGDPRYARPDLAPKSAQIAAAEKARDSGRGYSPWPVCRRAA